MAVDIYKAVTEENVCITLKAAFSKMSTAWSG